MEKNYSPPTLKNPHQSNILPYLGQSNNFSIINGSYSKDFALVENCKEFSLSIKENQRLRSILLLNNDKVRLSILDSAVAYSRKIRVINCKNINISIIDADIRGIEI